MLQDGSPIKWCCILYLKRSPFPGLNFIALLNHQVGLNKSTDFCLSRCGSSMVACLDLSYREVWCCSVEVATGVNKPLLSLCHWRGGHCYIRQIEKNTTLSFTPIFNITTWTLYWSKLPAESVYDSTYYVEYLISAIDDQTAFPQLGCWALGRAHPMER